MTSAAQKGAKWKGRTKKWLEAGGYQVAHLERVHYIVTDKGRIATKRDQFASDLLAVNAREVVFVQVKGGTSRRSQLSAARRAFAAFVFPAGTRQWIVLWRPRAHLPEVIVVSEGPCGAIKPSEPRRRTTAMPLFAAQ